MLYGCGKIAKNAHGIHVSESDECIWHFALGFVRGLVYNVAFGILIKKHKRT